MAACYYVYMKSWEQMPSSERENKFTPDQAIGGERALMERRSGKKRGVARILLLASVLSAGGFWAGRELGNKPDSSEATHQVQMVEKSQAATQESKRSTAPEHKTTESAARTTVASPEKNEVKAPQENIDESGRWVDGIVQKARNERQELQSPQDVESYARTLWSDLRGEIEFPQSGEIRETQVYGVDIKTRVYHHDDGKHVVEGIQSIEHLIQDADRQFGTNVYEHYASQFEDLTKKVSSDAASSYSREKANETIDKAEKILNEYNQ